MFATAAVAGAVAGAGAVAVALLVVVEDFLQTPCLNSHIFIQFRQLGVPNWQIVPLSSVFMSTSQRGGHLAVFQKHL